jgi:4-hydroxy-2-oxoheptanedioate aldolase
MDSFRDKLLSGKPQLGMCIMYPSPGVVERIGPDWDWIWIDGQHGQLGYQDTLALVRACDLVNRAALVRVPWLEAGHVGLVMDMNPAGVIVPCVDTAEQARSAVRAAKFPPLGGRSYGGRRPIDRKGRAYSDTANQDALLIVQIESPEAISNADAIAAVEGVDGIFLGPDDVLLRRGVSPTAPRDAKSLSQDMQTVAQAFRKHNKFGVMVGANPEMLKASLELGYHMIVAGGDVPFLANGSAKASADARAAIDGHGVTGGKSQTSGNASGSPY